MKILLAVDGSAYTKKMLAYVASHGDLFGPSNEFTLLTVQPPLPPRARAAVGADAAKEYYAEEAEKVTAPALTFLKGHGIEAKVVHEVGSPGEQIAKFADAGKYDMLMMGSHGHGTLGNLVMGSVATQVLAHCGVPVLLVR